MIDLKAKIYETLNADESIVAIVGDNIHIFSDDSAEMENFDERLPQITFARIVGTVTEVGVRNETFQISSWGKDAAAAEALSFEVIRVFNRTKTESWRACIVEHVNDSYDRETKAHGIHATIRFTMYDPTY